MFGMVSKLLVAGHLYHVTVAVTTYVFNINFSFLAVITLVQQRKLH